MWALGPAVGGGMIALAGCVSPLALHTAVVAYDKAAALVQAEMLLLNIARARNVEPLHFTSLSSVAATFNFEASAGIAPGGAGETSTTFAPLFTATIAEQPTITIVPVQGEEFTKRILAPVGAEKVAFLFQQDVEPAVLLRLMAAKLVVEHRGRFSVLRNDPLFPKQYQQFRRAVLYISALNHAASLYVGPIVYERTLPVSLPADSGSPRILSALSGILGAVESGFEWKRRSGGGRPQLVQQIVGRLAITNYDLSQLSNEARHRFNEDAEGHPDNSLVVGIRPDEFGGDFSLHGYFVFRSFEDILRFVAADITTVPEFHVQQEARTGRVPPGPPANPPSTLAVAVSEDEPDDAAFAVEYRDTWYSIKQADVGAGGAFPWDQEAFRTLNQLYQMTVTDVSRALTPAITIAK
jgi:hypothetical protein